MLLHLVKVKTTDKLRAPDGGRPGAEQWTLAGIVRDQLHRFGYRLMSDK
jgi:hypothetical protein